MNLDKALKIRGWMPDSELEWLAHEASQHKLMMEFGSFLGRSTRAICDNTEGKVWAVDHWKEDSSYVDGTSCNHLKGNNFEEFNNNLIDHIINNKLTIFLGTTKQLDCEYTDVEGKVDWIFIDADHLYESVKFDILLAKKLLRPGGIISGHDYNQGNWPGVKQAVDELVPNFTLFETIWYAELS